MKTMNRTEYKWICGWCESVNTLDTKPDEGDVIWCETCGEMSHVTEGEVYG